MIFLKLLAYLIVGVSLIAIAMMVICVGYVLFWELIDYIKERWSNR